MTKARVIVVICFVLTFIAGVAAGLIVGRFGKTTQRGSWLTRELKLTPEQREKMRQIWSQSMTSFPKQREQRNALVKEREERIHALLNKDQRVKYDEVMRDYANKSAALADERKKQFEAAQEQTKQILTEEQQRKYEELMKRQPGFRRQPREESSVSGTSSKTTPHSGD